jgi:hypothetical protein
MYAASKIWTRTSLQSTHKVSCMSPSLQILHSPSTLYVLFLFCEIPSKLLILSSERKTPSAVLYINNHQCMQSLNTKLQSKQNIIQHTKQSLRVFGSLSTVSVCSILHTPKPWPLRPRSREEETTAARHEHEQLLMYLASENLTETSLWSRESLKCESINL